MGKPTHHATKQQFYSLVSQGMKPHEAGRVVGVNKNSVTTWMRSIKVASGIDIRPHNMAQKVRGPIPYDDLSPEAKRGWDDFAYFRPRYFGRKASPWQEDAAWRFVEYLKNTKKRDFVVLSAAPEAGKTTLLHDIDAWLTIRQRSIRGMLLARTDGKAISMCKKLRRTFERMRPVQNRVDDVTSGRASDAVAVLCKDYGRFMPVDADIWRQEQFVVAQYEENAIAEKESTWMAFGLESDYMGYRFDLIQADDVITRADLRNAETLRELYGIWDDSTERRLDQGGTLIMAMQRLANNDLSAYLLDKLDGEDDDDEPIENQEIIEPEGSRKHKLYQHIAYAAHDEERCEGVHKGDGVKPWPEGCLLEPVRLPYKYLDGIRKNSPEKFELIYQQRDSQSLDSLISRVWIEGGLDPVTGTEHFGCYDRSRILTERPALSGGPTYSVVMVDPSPSKFWGLLWVCYESRTDKRHLIDVESKRLTAPRLINKEGNDAEGRPIFTGLLEDWWRKSDEIGLPIKDLVMEMNAAQVFLKQMPAFIDWCRHRGVRHHPHTTTAQNKNKEGLGVQIIAEHFEHGRWSIPLHTRHGSLENLRVKAYVDELCNYEFGLKQRDDRVMATWFFELHRPKIVRRSEVDESGPADRPSWLANPKRLRVVA